MKKGLQTIYLRVDSASKSLTKRALSQLLLKIIYSFSTPPTKELVVNELYSILGTKIKSDKIDTAIELLLNESKVTEKSGTYILSQAKKEKIEIAIAEFENRQKRIIEKYFNPISTPHNFISQWFEEVTIEFFNEYSSEWVSDLCLSTNGAVKNKHQGIKVILDLVTGANKNVLEKDKEWLKKQYIKFLQSNDSDVTSILWDYGTSRFSSSLIIANTSADPITIEEFTNSKCILDTNILMYLDLERGRFAESFKSMENIFINLNIAPVYFYITRDEFTRTMDHKRKDIIKVVENFSREVAEATRDPFLQTAIHRGCEKVEDYEEFFNQLMDIPSIFSELLEIKVHDSESIDIAISGGQKNEKLKDRINKVYKKKYHFNKRKNALLHDAGLISGAEFVRKVEKCFILSRDTSINEVALENPVINEMPIAIGLNTLINLLAIDNGGTDIDPTNCAPLFASIIKLALIPERDVFKPEDLSRMLDIETQIGNLPSEEIIDIAKEFHHNTITGVSEEETSLQVNRRFQRAKLGLQSDLEKSKTETHFEKEEKEKYIKLSDKALQKLRLQYTGDLQDEYDKELLRNRLVIFGLFPLITIIITVSIINNKDPNPDRPWLEYVIGVALNIVAWLLTDFLYLDKKVVSRYSDRVNKIAEKVEEKIRADVQE
ncbi:MAG: hypothetical protein IPI31_12520 [Bacteroidetes bacterium]|nr:hypothetical protein [Bacteroidota bacterium]